jgi:hypothetical protein
MDSNNNLSLVMIDFNDEGSLKRALVRTLGNAEALKCNVHRDTYEVWQDRIFDAIRQCRMELMVADNDDRWRRFNELLARANTTNSQPMSTSEVQVLNQARACYSFMRDQIESPLMISIKNIHISGNPLDLIRALKTKFSPATQVTVFQSLQSLLSVKLIPSESKNDFINRIRGLHQSVLRYNQAKTVEQLLDVLLNLVLYQSIEPNYQQQLKRDLYNDTNFSFIQAAKIVLAEEELVKLAKEKVNNNNNNSANNSDNQSTFKVNATMYNSKTCDICKTTSNHYTSDCFYNLLNKTNQNKFNNPFKGRKNNSNTRSAFNYKRKIQNNNISTNDNTNESSVNSDEESDNYNNYSYNHNNDNINKNINKNNKKVKFHSNLNKYKNNSQ